MPDAATAEAELAPPGTAAGDGAANAGEYRGPVRASPGQADASRRRAGLRPHGAPPRAPTASRCSSPRPSAPTPSRRGCSPPTPTRSGSRRRGSRCTASAPSSTSGRRAPTAGWRPTPGASTSVQRYSWEAWHFGFTLNAGSSSVGYAKRGRRRVVRALPAFVPARFAPAIARAAQRWSVSGALLAAQLYEESQLQPVRAVDGRRAGDRAVHARDGGRLRPGRSVRRRPRDRRAGAPDARPAARLRRGPARAGRLQRRPRAASRACGCVPPIPETQAYVADILGLLHGAGDPNGEGAGALEVRLVR